MKFFRSLPNSIKFHEILPNSTEFNKILWTSFYFQNPKCRFVHFRPNFVRSRANHEGTFDSVYIQVLAIAIFDKNNVAFVSFADFCAKVIPLSLGGKENSDIIRSKLGSKLLKTQSFARPAGTQDDKFTTARLRNCVDNKIFVHVGAKKSISAILEIKKMEENNYSVVFGRVSCNFVIGRQ